MSKERFEDNLRDKYDAKPDLDLDLIWKELDDRRNPRKSRWLIFFLLFPGVIGVAAMTYLWILNPEDNKDINGYIGFENSDRSIKRNDDDIKESRELLNNEARLQEEIESHYQVNSHYVLKAESREVSVLFMNNNQEQKIRNSQGLPRKSHAAEEEIKTRKQTLDSYEEETGTRKAAIENIEQPSKPSIPNTSKKEFNASYDSNISEAIITSRKNEVRIKPNSFESNEKIINISTERETLMNSPGNLHNENLFQGKDELGLLEFLTHTITLEAEEDLQLPLLRSFLEEEIETIKPNRPKNRLSSTGLVGVPHARFLNIDPDESNFIDQRVQSETGVDIFGVEIDYSRQVLNNLALGIGAGYTHATFLSEQLVMENQFFQTLDTISIVEYQNGTTVYILDSVIKTNLIQHELKNFHKYRSLYIPIRMNYSFGLGSRSRIGLTAGLDCSIQTSVQGELIKDLTQLEFTALSEFDYKSSTQWAAALSLNYEWYFQAQTGLKMSAWTKQDLSSRHNLSSGYSHKLQSFGLSAGLIRVF